MEHDLVVPLQAVRQVVFAFPLEEEGLCHQRLALDQCRQIVAVQLCYSKMSSNQCAERTVEFVMSIKTPTNKASKKHRLEAKSDRSCNHCQPFRSARDLRRLGSLCPRAVVQILVVAERWRCGVSALHMLESTGILESGEQAEACKWKVQQE
ncbi:hypothetical protein KCV06_g589, partial [Aureobasidium melanogenum]